MSTIFDPYVEWLGIRDAARPPNHYRLLGLEPFEEDRNVIANSADRQMAYLRTFQLGEHAKESQRILAEIAAAKVCLLNPQRKTAYDDKLRAAGVRRSGAKPAARPAAADKPSETEPAAGGIAIATDPRTTSAAARVGATRGKKKQQQQWLALGGVAAVVLLFAIAALAMLAGNNNEEVAGANQVAGASSPSKDNVADAASVGKENEAGASRPSENNAANTASPNTQPAWETAPTPAARGAIATFNQRQERTMTQPVVEALDAARQAMKQRNLDQAAEHIAAATEAAQTDDDVAEAASFDKLHGYLSEFWTQVDQQGRALRPGDKLDFADRQATVESNSGGALALSSGKHRKAFSLSPGSIPANVAVAVVQSGAHDVRNHARVAAFWALDQAGAAGRAYHAANAGQEQGQDTQPILDELAYEPSLVTVVVADAASVDVVDAASVRGEGEGAANSPDAGSVGHESTKHPVPSAAAQQTAIDAVREKFADLYAIAGNPAGAGQLAVTLLARAGDESDPAVQYMMLFEAQKMAINAGRIETFLEAVESMHEAYQIDKVRYQGAGVFRIAKGLQTDDDRKKFYELTQPMVDEFVALDRYSEAEAMIDLLGDLAAKLRDTEARREMGRRRLEVKKSAEAYARYESALAKLKENPNDPAANLAVGGYLAWERGDWDAGLPYLKKSEEETIRTAATLDSLSPGTPPEQANLGDLWWQLAGDRRLAGDYEQSLKRRGAEWYEKALPGLEGVAKETAEKRLRELNGGGEVAVPGEKEPFREYRSLVDDSDAGFSSVGDWKSSRQGVKEAHQYAIADGSAAVWSFSDIPDGEYAVLVTWLSRDNRSTAIEYNFQSKNSSASARVNQRLDPRPDLVVQGRPFQAMPKRVRIVDGNLVVRGFITNRDGYMIADAVAIVRVK